MSSSNCSSPSTASIAILVVGVVFFLVSVILWILFFLKRRRDQQKPPRVAPRVDGNRVEASGEYIDFQEESDKYESMDGLSNRKPVSRYLPSKDTKDAMEETFDGSRMPKTNAPRPPQHPPKSVMSSIKKDDGLTESGNDIYEDYDHDGEDVKDGGNIISRLKGRISRKFESSYDTPRSLTLKPASSKHQPRPKTHTLG